MRKGFLLKLILVFFLPLSCLAAKPLDVVINEICWMGNEISANDEWIELYNNTDTTIDLSGWKLISKDGSPKVELEGKIEALGFFLLERTDDESAPGILADLIYKGALNNKGEFLQLIDDKGNIIDEIDCKDSWLAGDNKTKQTMERIDSKLVGSDKENWQTSEALRGTPKNKNSQGKKPKPENRISKEQLAEVGPPPTVYPKGIFINEILPSPEGLDEENEYIEIFNQNNRRVDLTSWSLQDVEGTVKRFVFPEGTEIGPESFLVFFRPKTKITLNNSGDGLKLLKPSGEIADEIYYEKAPKGESFNRIKNNWVWSKNLTPNAENILSETKEEKPEVKKEKEKIGNLKEKELLGALPEILPQKFSKEKIPKNFLFALSIALILAIASGISIFLLKRKRASFF